jgi:hypothetical protein
VNKSSGSSFQQKSIGSDCGGVRDVQIRFAADMLSAPQVDSWIQKGGNIVHSQPPTLSKRLCLTVKFACSKVGELDFCCTLEER